MSTDALNCGTVDVKLNELVMQSRSGEEILSINLSRVKNCAVPVHNEVEVQCDTDGLLADQEACDMIRFFVPPDVDGMANAEELCDDVKALTNTSQGRYCSLCPCSSDSLKMDKITLWTCVFCLLIGDVIFEFDRQVITSLACCRVCSVLTNIDVVVGFIVEFVFTDRKFHDTTWTIRHRNVRRSCIAIVATPESLTVALFFSLLPTRYKDYLRLHGTTYDFSILYKNIIKIYLLPDPKSASQFLVMCLKEGIQQGRQVYKSVSVFFVMFVTSGSVCSRSVRCCFDCD